MRGIKSQYVFEDEQEGGRELLLDIHWTCVCIFYSYYIILAPEKIAVARQPEVISSPKLVVAREKQLVCGEFGCFPSSVFVRNAL
jgi:hypothetical protein